VIGRRDYESRRTARIERLRARAERHAAEGAALVAQGDRMASVIPMGQPILVGHHSERRDRSYRAKINGKFERGYASLKQAENLDRRADVAERNNAISSDDPNAVERLREKLAKLQADRDTMKRVNKAYSKGGFRAAFPNAKPEQIAKLAEKLAACPWDRKPYPSFALTNTGAEIRRVEKRIAELERRAARPEQESEEYGDLRIEETDNRVCVIFPGKPADGVRAGLRGAGFKWAPTMGAWVRMASEAAWYHARGIVWRYFETAAVPQALNQETR